MLKRNLKEKLCQINPGEHRKNGKHCDIGFYQIHIWIRFEPGVLTEVFDLLKHKVESMNTYEKLCTVTLDEMKIKEGYGYCPKTGHCYGKVNLPNHEGDATHALVFMMGGISTHWKQAVGYWFTPGLVTNANFLVLNFCS